VEAYLLLVLLVEQKVVLLFIFFIVMTMLATRGVASDETRDFFSVFLSREIFTLRIMTPCENQCSCQADIEWQADIGISKV